MSRRKDDAAKKMGEVMKLNDFKSQIEAHKRTFRINSHGEQMTIRRPGIADNSEHPQKHLPYHGVLRPQLTLNAHLLHP
jgi:hypothetical protein